MSNIKPPFLYIVSHKDWFWSHRLPLAREAQRQNFDVYVAYAGAAQDEKLVAAGFKGVDLPATVRGFTPVFMLRTMAIIAGLMWRIRPKVMHAFTLKYAFMAGLASLFAPRTRIIHTIAGLGYLFRSDDRKSTIIKSLLKPLIKLAVGRKSMHCIVQNPDDLQVLLDEKILGQEQSTLIRGSGVDTAAFKVTPLPDDGKPPLVLLPTRLVWEKGIEIFIAVANEVKSRGVNARFMIAGGLAEHNPRAIKESDMRRLLKGSDVEWPGRVNDMPALLVQTTLVLYPSWYGEGVPKVLLEAAASGRPIITTDHPGCREAVDNNVSGALVPVKDIKTTTDVVEQLLNDSETLKRMGQAGRKKAETEFDQAIIAAHVGELYKRALV